MKASVSGCLKIGDQEIGRGDVRNIELPVSQSYSGNDLVLPMRVERAPQEGPVVVILGAVHGDEINGTGIVRQVILDPPFRLRAGTLICVPVVNILGFERLSRYLPDRRDLNRCFPGKKDGSLASRFARTFFDAVIRQSDYCLDFHTAAVRRTNYPNIRADLSHSETRRIAMAFGCELVVDHKGGKGTLRSTSQEAGCATVTLEAGEVWKIEPGVVEVGLRGIRNVLVELGMVDGQPVRPLFQAEIRKSEWLRANDGGVLDFHVAPGDLVEKGQPIATITTLLGVERSQVLAEKDGIIFGLTTLPAVKPGDPICHLGQPENGIEPIRRALHEVPEETLRERLKTDLASNVNVTEVEPDDAVAQLPQP